MHIPVPDNGISIKPGDTSFIYKDVYHPIQWINDLPYRPRVETLIIKDGELVYLYMKNKDKGSSGVKGEYELPGGSTDTDSTPIQQAENEVNEEALMSIKDIYDTGIQYYENYPDGFIMGGGDTPLEYKGHISRVFVAKYSGIYNRGAVEKKDLDDKIAANGRFYRITDVADKLKEQHLSAIIDSPYVKPHIKGAVRILGQMNANGLKRDLKSLKNKEITGELVLVSKYRNLTDTYRKMGPIPFEHMHKVSVFGTIQSALAHHDVEHGGLKNGNIMYVYAVDDDSVELYTPSNQESPSAKITGELWIKSNSPIKLKKLGMIQIKTDGTLGYFYHGKHSEVKKEVLKCDFKWIVRENTTHPIMETNTIVPGNKLYHGSTYEITKFEPLSLDLGNASQEPGWSTFAFADYNLALRFGMMRAIQKAKDYWGKDITCTWDIMEKKPFISASDYRRVCELIQGFVFYVYTIDASNLEVGIGNDDRLPEYTFRESGITPEKTDLLRIDTAMIADHLLIIPDDEMESKMKSQETMAGFHHIRGWYATMMTRDYNNGTASAQLQKAVADGDLKPGDDVREYMNNHGISFGDDSVKMMSTVQESSNYYRVEYDGDGIYNAVKRNTDKLTWMKLLKSNDVKWLPKPPSYAENNRSYFTKDGYDMFTKKTLPLLRSYIDPNKLHISSFDELDGDIMYSDKYQVVTESIGDTRYKSTITKDFKNGIPMKLSSFTKFPLNKSTINKYKSQTEHFRYIADNAKGYIFVDGSELVAFVIVEPPEKGGTGDLSNYTWITDIEVCPKYRGHGLSKQLLDIAVKELKGDFLTVTYDNEVAINLYKSYGFKISKNSYEEVKSGKSRSKMYTMFYKNRHPDGVELVSESITPVTESLLFSKGVFEVHFDDFTSGKSNVVLVTGLSGSGKSTIAKKIADKYHAEWIELDMFEQCYIFETDEQLKECGEVFYEYLSSHKDVWKKLKEKSLRGNDFVDECEKFLKYTISWCKKDKSKKYVIEGVQIYDFLNKEKISGVPLLITGTSALKSLVRRLQRAKENGEEDFKTQLSELPQCIRWYIDENKIFEEFKKSVLETDVPTLEAAEYSSVNKYPIFIVLMHTGTTLATMIKQITRDEFSHAAIAFDSKLSTIYSFGTKKLGSREHGFTQHTLNNDFLIKYRAKFAVYVMYVSREQREKMYNRLQYFIDNKGTLKYDLASLIPCALKIPTEFRKKYFCSRFVMEIIGSAQELSKVPSLWTPQQISSLENISLVNTGLDLHNYDYKITEKNLNLIKQGRQDEIDLQIPVTESAVQESTRSELPDEVFGIPEHRKYPLDTKEHVQSAIKFFNYVQPEYEKELADNILQKVEEYGITPSVTERNRFSKYLTESVSLEKPRKSYYPNWSLVNTLDDEERRKLLKASAPYVNKPVVYRNSVYVAGELAGTINIFRDSQKESFGHIFIIIHPKFIKFCTLDEELLHEAQIEFMNPIWGIEWIVSDYSNQTKKTTGYSSWYMDLKRPENPNLERIPPEVEYNSILQEASMNRQDKVSALYKIIQLNDELNQMEYIIPNKGSIIREIKRSDFVDFYRVLSPTEFEKYNGGICWDYTIYEGHYFKDNLDYVPFKTFYVNMIMDDEDSATHTFLLFYLDSSVYWFESSWKPKRGIRKFNSEKDALNCIIHELLYNEENEGFHVNRFEVTQYNSLDKKLIGLSCIEFMEYMERLPKYNFHLTGKRCSLPDPINSIQSLPMHTIPTTESTLFSDKDIYHKFDEFESGKSNILFVTGLSGSGKSTLAYNLTKKYGGVYVELDLLHYYFIKDNEFTTDIEKQLPKEVRDIFHGFTNSKHASIQNEAEYCYQFIQFIIDWAKDHGETRYIIEGVQLADLEMGDELINYPLIITGSSVVKSVYRASIRREHMSLREMVKCVPEMFSHSKNFDKKCIEPLRGKIFESGCFEKYRQYADLDSAAGPIQETWIPLTEAPAIDEPEDGDTPTDYTADVDGGEPQGGESTDDGEESSTDYTEEVDDDNDPDDTSEEENQGDDPEEGTSDGAEEEPTDYTDDVDGEDDNPDDENTEEPETDSTDSDQSDENSNPYDNNVVKNYSLLKNFEKLYELTKEVSDSLDAKVEPTELQNKVLAQVLKNLNSIKEFILSYVKFQFSEDNYPQNLYYYNIVLQSLKLNLKLLKRNQDLGKSKL